MRASYYWPIFKAYPETDFGGIFETEADYRDPAVKTMIADGGGWELWPPIRFSYNTQNKNPPMAFPVKPTWLLTDEDCKLAVERRLPPVQCRVSNGTGSAPTIRAATWWRASSTASAFRCCSASCSRCSLR